MKTYVYISLALAVLLMLGFAYPIIPRWLWSHVTVDNLERFTEKVVLPLFIVIVGLVVERHKHALVGRLMFWNRRNDLIGNWHSVWREEAIRGPLDADGAYMQVPEKTMIERIVIQSAHGRYISGYGTNADLGAYDIKGNVSGDTLNLQYAPQIGTLRQYAGVVMLKLQGTELRGVWAQNVPKSDIKSGTCVWTRPRVS